MNNKNILIIILIFALLIRLPHILDKQQGTDEKLSINNAKNLKNINNLSILTIYNAMPSEVNPPLFFMILGFSLGLFNSIITLKFLVIIIGILSVISFYFLVKELFDYKFALFSTFLYSLHPMHIIYSQHIRAYILLFLLFNLSLLFLYRILKENKLKNLISLGIIFVLSFYTHYYSLLFIVSESLIILYYYILIKKTKIKDIILMGFLVFILCIPALILFKMQFSRAITYVSAPKLVPLLIPYPLYKLAMTIDVSTIIKNFSYLIVLFPIFISIFVYGLYKLLKNYKLKAIFLSSNLFLPYILLLIIGFVLPVFSFRYITFLLPPYIILFSYGIYTIKNTKLKYFLIILTLLFFIFSIFYYYNISTIYHWPINIAI